MSEDKDWKATLNLILQAEADAGHLLDADLHQALRVRIAAALAVARAEERERCARIADKIRAGGAE